MLFWTTDFVRFDVAVKEEEEAAVAAMDELAEANKEFLQGMGGVVGEEALEYVKFVIIAHAGGTRCVTANTDNTPKIHVCITLGVAFIRACLYVLFYC